MYLGLGSHCSLIVLEVQIRRSGVCGSYTYCCLLQLMASYCLCISQNQETSCLVSAFRTLLSCIILAGFRLLCHAAVSLSSAARPAFYKYVIIMFVVDAVALLACGLGVMGAGLGIWYLSTLQVFQKRDDNCSFIFSFMPFCLALRYWLSPLLQVVQPDGFLLSLFLSSFSVCDFSC